MLPWTTPLWLTVAYVAATVIINITIHRCRKTLVKRQEGKQEDKPRTRDVTYWIYTIISPMMTLINAIALTLLVWLSAVGMTWLHANRIYTFMIVTYVIIGVGSSFATHRFLIGALDYRFFIKKDPLIDPYDQTITIYVKRWVIFNVITDIVLWMLMVSIPEPIRQFFS